MKVEAAVFFKNIRFLVQAGADGKQGIYFAWPNLALTLTLGWLECFANFLEVFLVKYSLSAGSLFLLGLATHRYRGS